MDFIGEILVSVGSALAGFAIGSVVFLLVRLARWALMGTERTTRVTDPRGSEWTVRIPLAPAPMRFWVSQRLLRMRPSDRRRRKLDGVAADGVSSSELAHPGALVSKTDEAASVVAVLMLAFVLLALVVLVFEAVLVILVAIVVAVVRLIGGHWQYEVVDPDGHTERRRCRFATRCEGPPIGARGLDRGRSWLQTVECLGAPGWASNTPLTPAAHPAVAAGLP